MLVGVTGAGGALGRAVVRRLAGRVPVVALTRHPERRAAAEGLLVREADFDRPRTLAAAFAGLDRLLVISTDARSNDTRTAQHAAALDAAAAAGVGHVVYTSLVGAGGPPEFLNAAHTATEARLKADFATWTILRNNLYLDGLDAAAPGGVYVTNSGSGAVAYVTREDCAAAAAEVLAAPDDRYAGRVLEVNGPAALDANGVAALLSERTGAPVTARVLEDDDYRAHLTGAGLPEGMITALITLGRAIRAGRYASTRPWAQATPPATARSRPAAR
ncbi:NAD(P)H-binding protein [Cryptosporangium arvum]|uniref:Putative nucleoside-diphosphate sugar epimerase n=1 Tax=Cryptosporangium arvum DSM 44712 TaxID=927661 RepID=A0A010ZT61_9ACTN|nr:NAD(P)H-binding protein [Cryptosporangium arvum]EXG81884.1 putative nucleoside-diphosphate sugar epimerase [Cryptosporangium arvum DSM 44712]